MAKDKKQVKDLTQDSNVKKLFGFVQSGLNKLYQNTFYTTPENRNSREAIGRDINNALDHIISNNLDISGEPNISRLYSRIMNAQNDKDTVKAFEKLFDDKQLMSSLMASYSDNRYLYDFDGEIDIILKYMPKLHEALKTKRDNVLTTDHFSKDYITAINTSDITNDDIFSKRMDEIKKQYRLLDKFEEWYDMTSKYGDQFIYIVPYSKAFKNLLKNKIDEPSRLKMSFESGVVCNVDGTDVKLPKKFNNVSESTWKSIGNIEIECNFSGKIESAIQEHADAMKERESIHEQSMSYMFEQAMTEGVDLKNIAKDIATGQPNTDQMKSNVDVSKLTKLKKLKKVPLIPDEDLDKYLSEIDKENKKNVSSDGLTNLADYDNSKVNIDILGCVVKTLDRHCVLPCCVDGEICLGYYYFEFENKDKFDYRNNPKYSSPMLSMNNTDFLTGDGRDRDRALRYISSELSKYIDAKFIKKNQDLKRELYAILKYNETMNLNETTKIRVTFIPAEDIVHCYNKIDRKTHRGISDLQESLLPAKLYTAMYITASIMTMTRGYDKRVYYVDPGTEDNITDAMLTVLDQVKKGNFGLRQIRTNLNQVLNITGRFNDFIIPKQAGGDAPIQMEVLQGQDINIKTDLMQMLEQMAVNATEVPMDVIETRLSVDYAIQLSMSNSKFLRVCFKRQSVWNELGSRILTKIYNYQYNTHDSIEFELPPPVTLNVVNSTQFMDNLNNLAAHICEIEWNGSDDDEQGKNAFMKEIKKLYAGTFYNKNLIAKTLARAKQVGTIKPVPDQDQQ